MNLEVQPVTKRLADPRTWRFTTCELLAFVVFVAVMAWSLAESGLDNGLFWGGFVVAGIYSAIFVAIARKSPRRQFTPMIGLPVLGCFGAGFIGFPMYPSFALLFQAIGLFIAGCVVAALRRDPRPRTLWSIALVCWAAAFIPVVLLGRSSAEHLAELRAQYPAISLAERLSYESHRNPSGAGTPAPALNPDVEALLMGWESDIYDGEILRRQFRAVHAREYELFVRARGFGNGRMFYIGQPYSMETQPLREIRFDDQGADDDRISHLPNSWSQSHGTSPSDDPLDALHVHSEGDFLDPLGFGAVIDRHPLRVAGFIEHAFHFSLRSKVREPDDWAIRQLQLVSLLKFSEPRVYVQDHLPRMDQLSAANAPTRALDAFELAALQQLRTQEDIVTEETSPGHFRMLGSLRAGTNCLDCHNVQRGELLGAFTYELERIAAPQSATNSRRRLHDRH